MTLLELFPDDVIPRDACMVSLRRANKRSVEGECQWKKPSEWQGKARIVNSARLKLKRFADSGAPGKKHVA